MLLLARTDPPAESTGIRHATTYATTATTTYANAITTETNATAFAMIINNCHPEGTTSTAMCGQAKQRCALSGFWTCSAAASLDPRAMHTDHQSVHGARDCVGP